MRSLIPVLVAIAAGFTGLGFAIKSADQIKDSAPRALAQSAGIALGILAKPEFAKPELGRPEETQNRIATTAILSKPTQVGPDTAAGSVAAGAVAARPVDGGPPAIARAYSLALAEQIRGEVPAPMTAQTGALQRTVADLGAAAGTASSNQSSAGTILHRAPDLGAAPAKPLAGVDAAPGTLSETGQAPPMPPTGKAPDRVVAGDPTPWPPAVLTPNTAEAVEKTASPPAAVADGARAAVADTAGVVAPVDPALSDRAAALMAGASAVGDAVLADQNRGLVHPAAQPRAVIATNGANLRAKRVAVATILKARRPPGVARVVAASRSPYVKRNTTGRTGRNSARRHGTPLVVVRLFNGSDVFYMHVPQAALRFYPDAW